MKLIDLLVQELPKRGGWPKNLNFIAQDNSDVWKGSIYAYKTKPLARKRYWIDSDPFDTSGGFGIKIFNSSTIATDAENTFVTREQYEAELKAAENPYCRSKIILAHSFLEKGVQHMKDRAVQRDSEDGERSMKACVDAFNAMFGHNLTETQGWQFMVLLKMSRSRNKFHPDDYEDGSAYTALAGEARSHEQK